MKTDSLIHLLARGAGAAPRAVAARRLAPAALAGTLISGALALAMFGPLPMAMYASAVPWMKMGYAAALALVAGWLTAKLARPVARLGTARRAVISVIAAMGLLGATSLLLTPPGERMEALLGHSWFACPWNVLALSLPALGGAMWAVRGLAPTRPRAAGFAAGLLSGAMGAFGYALSCPEASPAFVAVWYTVGILLTASLGALVGPRLLRW